MSSVLIAYLIIGLLLFAGLSCDVECWYRNNAKTVLCAFLILIFIWPFAMGFKSRSYKEYENRCKNGKA